MLIDYMKLVREFITWKLSKQATRLTHVGLEIKDQRLKIRD